MAKTIKYEDENGVKYPTPVIEDSFQKKIDRYKASEAQKKKNLQRLGNFIQQKLHKKRTK